MAHVLFSADKLAAVNCYTNSIHNTAKRRYALEYVRWLRNGGEGLEPSRGGLSSMAAQAVRLSIAEFKLWEAV